jgi:NAD-dependent dihydropyrimidine dehydrogenase PreA subunit
MSVTPRAGWFSGGRENHDGELLSTLRPQFASARAALHIPVGVGPRFHGGGGRRRASPPAEGGSPPGHGSACNIVLQRGAFPTLSMAIRSERCNHCDRPPCVACCPTGASHVEESFGRLVEIDPAPCIGCKACLASCPYGARFIHPEGCADGSGGAEEEKEGRVLAAQRTQAAGPGAPRAAPRAATLWKPASRGGQGGQPRAAAWLLAGGERSNPAGLQFPSPGFRRGSRWIPRFRP